MDTANAEVRYWLANAYRMHAKPDKAYSLFSQLIAESPGDEQFAFGLAFLLRDQGQIDRAVDVLSKLSRRSANDGNRQLRIAGFLRDVNAFDAAIDACQLAKQSLPDSAEIDLKLARMYQATGDFDKAAAAARAALSKNHELGGAWLVLAHSQQFCSDQDNNTSDDLELMRQRQAQLISEEARMANAFALGKALDDCADYASAWKNFVLGNDLASLSNPWKQEHWKAFIEQRLSSNGRQIPGPEHGVEADRRPLFIVGMLRSGTTFLEQRLDRHDQIQGRGELNMLSHLVNQGRVNEEGADELWRHLQRDDSESRIFVDKNPLNFRYLAELRQMMPHARVIHMQRDGRNSCLSCFMQLFQHPDTAFTYRLDQLVAFYAGYRQLMDHCERSFPGWIHTVQYEDLVTDPRDNLAAIADYLEIEWSESLLETGDQQRAVRTASAWQARQPIYTRSLDRWKHYRDQAETFFKQIEEIDRRFSAARRDEDTDRTPC